MHRLGVPPPVDIPPKIIIIILLFPTNPDYMLVLRGFSY
jgi:hypothetical protein